MDLLLTANSLIERVSPERFAARCFVCCNIEGASENPNSGFSCNLQPGFDAMDSGLLERHFDCISVGLEYDRAVANDFPVRGERGVRHELETALPRDLAADLMLRAR